MKPIEKIINGIFKVAVGIAVGIMVLTVLLLVTQ